MDGDRFDAITRRFGRRSGRRTFLGWAAATAAALAVRRESGAQGICTLNGGLCPMGCYPGSSCAACCGGQCAGSGVCASTGCIGYGCACTGGLSFQCGYGLTCCTMGGSLYGSGTCQYTCPWGR